MQDKRLLKSEEVCKYLGISKPIFLKEVKPYLLKIDMSGTRSTGIRYDLQEVNAFIEIKKKEARERMENAKQ